MGEHLMGDAAAEKAMGSFRSEKKSSKGLAARLHARNSDDRYSAKESSAMGRVDGTLVIRKGR
jgi:hypothetical protein